MTGAAPARIGLALGGGGARGLAHIVILEAFDELGLKPHVISATSIGALIGAAYASGMSAADIRTYCNGLLARRSAVLRHVYARWRGSLWNFWNPRTPALFGAEALLQIMLPHDLPETFEALQICLLTVATDYYGQCAHVSSAGPLLPAIAASAALPALFTPVKLDDRILIDGGFVNPLPFDLLREHSDIIVAVDVSGGVSGAGLELPGSIETIVGAQQIALKSIIKGKLENSAPDILLRPKVGQFRVLDFLRKDEILAAASLEKEMLKRALDLRLNNAVA